MTVKTVASKKYEWYEVGLIYRLPAMNAKGCFSPSQRSVASIERNEMPLIVSQETVRPAIMASRPFIRARTSFFGKASEVCVS